LTTIQITKRYRDNGEEYWADCTGQVFIAESETVSEARKLREVALTEPGKRPLTPAEEQVKENAKLLNLSEAEAEAFARGR
jgi:hypothetical protein